MVTALQRPQSFDGSIEAKALDASGPRDTPAPTPGGAFQTPQPQAPKKPSPITYPQGINEAFVLDWVKRTRARFKKFARREFQKIEDSHKLFESISIAGMSKAGVFLPICNSIVETDTARRVTAMFNKSKVVDAVPMEVEIRMPAPPPMPGMPAEDPEPDDENKLLVEDLINQEILFSAARTSEKGFDCMKGQGIEGTFIAKAYWQIYECQRTEPDIRHDPMTNQDIQVGEKVVTYTKGRPQWNPCALPNLIWDPRLSTRIQDSKYVGEDEMSTLNELLLKQQLGEIQDVDGIQKSIGPVSDPDAEDDELKRKKALGENATEKSDADDGVYRMTEWHAWLTWQKLDEVTGGKTWTTECFRFRTINDQKVVRFEVNPLKRKRMPYFSGRYSIRPRQFLGNPITQPVKGLQVHANNLMGSEQELLKKAAQNPTFYERASGLDGRKTILTENSLIPVLNADKVKHFPVDVAALQSVTVAKEKAIQLMRETTASNEQSQGIKGDVQDTATAEQIMAQSAATRFQAVADLAGFEFFAALAQEFYDLCQQFAQPGDLIVRESSVDGMPRQVTAEDLKTDYLFIPVTTASQMNREAQARKQQAVLTTIMQAQATNPQMFTDNQGNAFRFDGVEFFIKEYLPLVGVKNGRTYFKKITAQQQMQQAALQGGLPARPQGSPQGGPSPMPAAEVPQPEPMPV